MRKYERTCDGCGKPVSVQKDGDLILYKDHLSRINELHEMYLRQLKLANKTGDKTNDQ